LNFFLKKVGLNLGIWEGHACKDEFMQQPQRRRRRQHREEEVAWRGGLGCDEVVRLMAQGVSAVGGRRKGCRRKESAEKRGKTSWELCLSLMRIWVGGEAETPSVGGGGRFLWGLQGLKKQRDRERRENVGWKKNRGEAGFLGYFEPDFLLPQAITSASIYRRWKRVISSALG